MNERAASIADPADPRLAPFRDVADPRRIREQGLFVAEGRRVVAQCRCERSASRRSARCGEPFRRKCCSSGQVGYSGAHISRDTAKAPQALAQAEQVSSGSPVIQPRRNPAMKPSPAPSTL